MDYTRLGTPFAYRWPFKNVKIVGFVEHLLTLANVNYKLTHHSLFEKFVANPCEEAEWAVVQPTYENVMSASLKYDVEQNFSFLQRPETARALRVIEEYYTPYWTVGPMDWSEVWAQFDFDTASGFPFSSYGLQKKGDILEFPEEFCQFMTFSVISGVPILWKTTPKVEFLLLSDIVKKNKIRLFMSAGMHAVAWQKRLYGLQNKAVMNSKWIKIGTNMRSGGCHRLTRELECEPGEFVVEFDLPRCDKNHKLMGWIYWLRNKCLQASGLELLAAQWIQRNMSSILAVLWDGTVMESKTINPSGQGNTADDNCLWMLCVVLVLCVLACPDVTDFELKELCLHIYSDDFRGRFGPRFTRLRDAQWVSAQLKEVFQIELEPSEWYVYDQPDGSHFLGADTVLAGSVYLPIYNTARLRAAFCYTEGVLTVGQDLMRLRQLLILAWPSKKLFTELSAIYLDLLRQLAGSRDAEVQVAVNFGMPREVDLLRVFTGYESGFSGAGFKDFTCSMEVGGVKSLRFSMDGVQRAKVKEARKAGNQVKGKLARRGSHPGVELKADELGRRLERIVGALEGQRGSNAGAAKGPGAQGGGKGNEGRPRHDVGGNRKFDAAAGNDRVPVLDKKKKKKKATLSPVVSAVGKSPASIAESVVQMLSVQKPAFRELLDDKADEAFELAHNAYLERFRASIEPNENTPTNKEFEGALKIAFDKQAFGFVKVMKRTLRTKRRAGVLIDKFGEAKLATLSDFNNRIKSLGSTRSDPARKKWMQDHMLGAAEGTVYHGSDPLTMDIKNEGKTGVRIAGHQWVAAAITGNQVPNVGCRLDGFLLNPIALGGRLTSTAMGYEQCKAHHLVLVYRPSVGTNENGNLGFYYRADPSTETQEIGQQEYQAASGHEAFESTNVWNATHLDIEPQNINVRYADAFNGDMADDVQGIVQILTGNNCAINKTYGDFYLEYDFSFYSPEQDYSIPTALSSDFTLKWNAYTAMVQGGIVYLAAMADAAPLQTVNFTTPPPSSEYMIMLFVKTITSGTNGSNLVWRSANNADDTVFNTGQLIWGRFHSRGPTNWTDGDTCMALYRDLDSASGVVSIDLDGPTDGQLTYVNTNAAPITFTVTGSARFVPLNLNS